jgi:hypothetical protein
MVAVSTMTKYGHLPNRGETVASRSGPVEETATFNGSVSFLDLFEALLDGFHLRGYDRHLIL